MDFLKSKSNKTKALVFAGLILVIVLCFFVPTYEAYAQSGSGQTGAGANLDTVKSTINADKIDCGLFDNWDQCVLGLFRMVLGILLRVCAFILMLSGMILDFVLRYTVVDMAAHINGGVSSITGGDIPAMSGINIAWKIIRDILNIAFIFLLVYQGIKMIIGQTSTDNIKKFISMIILASVLVNFSLFFTKVLIDASNIVTIGIYNSIVDKTAVAVIPGAGSGDVPTDRPITGLSVPFMSALGLQGIFSANTINTDEGTTIILYLVGCVLFIVVAFVFFAIACMFIIRYVTLIILLTLSPIAYMGLAIPFLKKYGDQWWDSLKNQLLFAPIYMIMTSVVLTLMTSDGFIVDKSARFSDITTGASQGSMGLILNFAVIVGLAIASLVIAKDTAKKGSALIGQGTSKLTAFAGGAVMGGSAWAMRKPLGALGNMGASSADLQIAADKKRSGIWDRTKGAAARVALYGSKTARDATFDVRNASIPTNVVGDVIAGTVGRTTAGRFLGLDNAKIPSIAVGASIAGMAGVGKGGTKGYAEEKAASEKERRDREAKNKSELALAEARRAVKNGANADPATAAGVAAIDAMEKALAKLSAKETEALVASNRELLESQNFANKISVQQLEAINKSDQFSETEKSKLKAERFKEIETIYNPAALTAYAAAVAIPAGARNASQVADVKRMESARKRVAGLSDSELEMVDAKYFDNTRPEGVEFISQLKPGQAETIIKSSKYTSGQKTAIREQRKAPLIGALSQPAAAATPTTPARPEVIGNPAKIKEMLTKKLGTKDIAGLMGENITFVDHAGITGTFPILTHPEILDQLTPALLKKIALELSASEIQTMHDVIEAADKFPLVSANVHKLATWLNSPDGAAYS